MFGTPIISDNGLPLLTENIFQAPLLPFIWTPRLLIFRSSVGPPPFIWNWRVVFSVHNFMALPLIWPAFSTAIDNFMVNLGHLFQFSSKPLSVSLSPFFSLFLSSIPSLFLCLRHFISCSLSLSLHHVISLFPISFFFFFLSHSPSFFLPLSLFPSPFLCQFHFFFLSHSFKEFLLLQQSFSAGKIVS